MEYVLYKDYTSADMPVTHRFTDGMYIRQAFLHKGSKITSKIHNTKHPFVILKGDVSVFSENEGVVRYRAPMFGITKPATRRVLLVHEDTIWITFHPAEEKTVEEIENRIITKHTNPMIAYDRLLNALTQ